MPRVGPGPDAVTLVRGGVRVDVRIAPNAGGRRENEFVVRTSRGGRPLPAVVSIRFAMPAMGMPPLGLRLRQVAPGTASGSGAKLPMPGTWQLSVTVVPRGAPAFTFELVDVVRL